MKTPIDKSKQPHNLLTVQEWQAFGKHHLPRVNWKKAMWKFADKNGIAVCLLTDDKVLTLQMTDGKMKQLTHRPGTWEWLDTHVAALYNDTFSS